MRNDNLDLTVVICVYNGERYIGETLNSLYEQTFKNFDLLIIDDCSVDDTVPIVRAFLEKHDWLNGKIISLPKNGGLARARKYSEQRVQTELVIFFDADDVASPKMLENLYSVMEREPNCMGVSCYCEYIDTKSNLIGGGIYMGPKTREEFLRKALGLKLMFLPPATMFHLKTAIAAGGRAVEGFPEEGIRYQDMGEDLDLWCRMSDFYKEDKYFLVVPEILFKYRKHINAVSSSSRAMNDRMRHIKSNLRRRRNELMDQNFIEYIASLTRWERIKNFFYDLSTDYYKQAGFNFIQKKYFWFLVNLILASVCSPRYVSKKLQNNVLQFLR